MPRPITTIGTQTYNPIATEPLGIPSLARQISAISTSTNAVLTDGILRISMYASGASIRYSIGSSTQTATVSSHLIANGERLDVKLPATPNIAVLRANSTDGVLEITELF